MGDETKQAEIIARWEARAEEEGRAQVGTATYTGTCVWRCRTYGWIRPTNAMKLPKKVREQMAAMTAEFRAKSEESGETSPERFAEDVLYFRISDRAAIETKIDKDMDVNFQVYVDNKGAGAME